MNHASFVQIQDFCQTGSGTTPSRQKTTEYYGGNVPWVKSGELRETVITDTEEHVTERALEDTSLKRVPAGALLVAMYGATVGRVGRLGIDATTNQAVCHILPDPQKANASYMFHALQHKARELIGRGVGGAQPNISQEIIRRISIYLPSLDEQRRIAAILDQADALRRKRQRAINRLNELGQSVFLEMFGTPVKGERRWPLERFSDVTDTKLGKMLDRGKFKGWTHYRYLRNANVRWFGFDLSDLKTMEIGDSEMERFLVLPGDLIICEGGEPGRCAVWAGDDGGPIFYQKALHRCRVNSTKLMPEYLCHLLWNFAKSGLLADSVTSATIAHLTGEKLARLDIPIPPIDLQREFRQRVRGIQNLGDCQKQHIAYLDGLFGSLQQRAFHGEL